MGYVSFIKYLNLARRSVYQICGRTALGRGTRKTPPWLPSVFLFRHDSLSRKTAHRRRHYILLAKTRQTAALPFSVRINRVFHSNLPPALPAILLCNMYGFHLCFSPPTLFYLLFVCGSLQKKNATDHFFIKTKESVLLCGCL